MFERYTEPARRVIFFARFEAGQIGAEKIETGHLLLGLVRQDPRLLTSVLGATATGAEIRRRLILKPEGEPRALSVDMRFANPSKRALAYAAEEAGQLQHKHIGTEHLLLGLMREQGGEAYWVLKEMGADLLQLRERFKKGVTHADPEVSQTGTEVPFRAPTARPELIFSSGSNAGFEHYTMKARRAIFFARFEASQFGAEAINTEHLLLGIWREGAGLINELMGRQDRWPELRKRILAQAPEPRKKISTSVDMPLSDEVKRALAGAAEEMKLRKGSQLGIDDLLLGLLRVEGCFAAELLGERGADVEEIRRRRDRRGTEGRVEES